MIAFGLLVCCLALTANGANLGRVIGGTNAPDHKYPYQVSLRERNPGYADFHFCSGSILNEKWVLTAAHCFEGRDLSNAWVVAGTNYLSEKGESYKIFFAVTHEEYTEFYHDDIALVRVEGEIKFTENVKPIALPTQDLAEYNVPGDFAGWGSTTTGGAAPNELQEIKLTVIPYEKCLENRPITKKHICSYNQPGEGICHGDSGGPLVVNKVQVGIASYVMPCAVGYPDVYTKVLTYVDWISKTQETYAFVLP